MKRLRLPLFLILLGGNIALLQSQINIQPDPDAPDLVKVYVKQDPTTYQKTSSQNSSIDFAVQVAASSKPISESNARKEWNELGHVYVQQENGMYKVRIGPFDTQLEAKQILLQAKSKGRKDAFIVVLQGIANDKPLFQSGMEKKPEAKPKTEKKVAIQQEAKEASQMGSEGPGFEFKVRIASFLKPGAFNPSGLEKLGNLESYRKGDLTIMMIGGFHNPQDAQKARDAVIAKGYKDASIAVVNNGILEEVVIK